METQSCAKLYATCCKINKGGQDNAYIQKGLKRKVKWMQTNSNKGRSLDFRGSWTHRAGRCPSKGIRIIGWPTLHSPMCV